MCERNDSTGGSWRNLPPLPPQLVITVPIEGTPVAVLECHNWEDEQALRAYLENSSVLCDLCDLVPVAA